MDPERAQWLALTTEDAVEPELPICDPHHHLWDQPADRYLLEELRADTGAGHNVQRTVFIECGAFYRADGPVELRPVGETDYVAALAENASTQKVTPHDLIQGIVAFVDLRLGRQAEAVLEAHRAAGRNRFRGIRHAVAWDASDQVRNHRTDPPPSLLRDERFIEGVRLLGELGLTYDVWLYHPQLPEVVELAMAAPGTTVIVDHLGGPLGVGPYAQRHDQVLDECRTQLARLAELPNVVLKLGGIGMTIFGQRWHRREIPPSSSELADFWGPHVRWCIEQFGPSRCMFESNFPPDRASCSYVVLWNAFKRISAGYDPADRAQLLHDTAAQVYRLGADQKYGASAGRPKSTRPAAST
jgi:predicted TIM-barrel fold metal-dependent hydrolase